MDRSNCSPTQLFQTGHILNRKRFGSEKIFFRLDITNLLNMNVRGSGKRYLLLAELIFEQYIYHWQREKENFNIVLAGK